MLNENTTNLQIDLLNLILQGAALDDPNGFKQFLSYAEDSSKLKQLFNHPEIQTRATQIKDEIDQEIKIQAESFRNKKKLFIKKQENLFILCENEKNKNGDTFDVEIKQLTYVLKDPNASVEDKVHASNELYKIYKTLEIKDKLTPEEKRHKEILNKVRNNLNTVKGILEWIKKNPKLLITDAVTLITIFQTYQILGIGKFVPDIIEDTVIGGLLGLEWRKLSAQYLKDKFGKKVDSSKLAAFLYGAAVSAMF